MKNKNNVVIVMHQNGMKCLFGVPDGVLLFKGNEVICETKHGEQKAVCITDSGQIDDTALTMLVDLLHATLPLKMVVGKYVVERFEVGE